MNQPYRKILTTVCMLLHFCSYSYAQLGPWEASPVEATDLERVQVGDRAPDFTLEDINGERVSLSDFRGKKDVVLVFYRGRW